MINMFWDIYVKLCADLGKSANNVAQQLGIASASVNGWKNGAAPRNSTLRKIADYFGVSVDYLLGNEEPHSSEEPKLSEGEEMLLDLFRRIPEDKQELILQMIRVAVENL